MNRFLRTFRDAPATARTAQMDEVLNFVAMGEIVSL
jgi:hypothetical protein